MFGGLWIGESDLWNCVLICDVMLVDDGELCFDEYLMKDDFMVKCVFGRDNYVFENILEIEFLVVFFFVCGVFGWLVLGVLFLFEWLRLFVVVWLDEWFYFV